MIKRKKNKGTAIDNNNRKIEKVNGLFLSNEQHQQIDFPREN